MIFFAQYRYGGRYTVSMLPGDGIGPEMMGYVKDIFREVGAPVDFETVELDPTTDNYDDLHNVITCQLIYFILFLLEISDTFYDNKPKFLHLNFRQYHP